MGRPANPSRDEARAAGEKVYVAQDPCIDCFDNRRYVANARCVTCSIRSVQNRRQHLDEEAREALRRSDHDRYAKRKSENEMASAVDDSDFLS